jgi:7-alpha-hydroxysteroid dehydrogenase
MILDRFRMTDRVAIVTGSGKGIGAGCARAFAEAGADLVLCARTSEDLERKAEEIRALGRRALVVPCDVTDTSNLQMLVNETMKEFGRINVVVNNVGGSLPRGFLETSERMFETIFHFNVTTAFMLSKLASPHMLEAGGGAILNMSSGLGRFSGRGWVAYGTAKAGLAHMTRMAARDLGPRIRVNALAIGAVETEGMVENMSEEARRELGSKATTRRLGRPEDIAAAAVWLCSEAGSWMTGKVVEVDGGIETGTHDLDTPDL